MADGSTTLSIWAPMALPPLQALPIVKSALAALRKGEPPPAASESLIEEVCEWLAGGESLREWSRQRGVAISTALYWQEADPRFAERYARARVLGAETSADDMNTLRRMVLSGEIDPQAARVAMDALKWETAKRNPAKFGDNLQVRHADADGGKLDTKPLVAELLNTMQPGSRTEPVTIDVTPRNVTPRKPPASGDSRARDTDVSDLV